MLNRRTVLVTAAGLAFGGGALAQAPSAEEVAVNTSFHIEGRYLPYYAFWKTKDPGPQRASMVATVESMVGGEADAFRDFGPQVGSPPPAAMDAWRAALPIASAQDAISAIAKAAAGRRIVILNEAHHVSRCRAFAIEVARVLRGQGFTHFAAEGFTVVPTGPAVDLATVSARTGFYIKDPVFAGLLREIRDGWQGSFAYEARADRTITDPREQIAFREEHQAETLADILKRDPQMKLFVYCGYAHATKIPQRGMPWMATRLWEKTGIEPLTITQSNGAPAPDPQYSWPGVEAVLAQFQPKNSIVLQDREGVALSMPSGGGYDLSVFHPRLPDRDGRPGWLAALPGRKPARVDVPAGPGLRLVQAIPTRERAASASAVPADQVLVEDNRRSVDLWLPPGAYDLCCETLSGKTQISSVTV